MGILVQFTKKGGRFYSNFNHWASLDLNLEDLRKKYPNGKLTIEEIDSEALLIQTKNLIKFGQELIRRGEQSNN